MQLLSFGLTVLFAVMASLSQLVGKGSPDRCKHGDPFPLPAFSLQSQLEASGVCMPQRGPWICNALSTLVQPEFNPHKHSHAAHGPSAVQAIALDRIHHALSMAGAPDASLTPDGCLRDMLKGQSLYGEMRNNLATYDRSKLRVLSSPQPLIDRLPKHARAFQIFNFR